MYCHRSAPELGIVNVNPFKSHIIEVVVGSSKEKFYVHKDVICAASPFFRRCLENDMKEASTSTVYLPEDNPEAFQCILKWVYSKVIETPKARESYNSMRLYEAQLLADKLCMEVLSNLLMDMIVTWHDTMWSCASILPEIPESPLKDFLVAQLAWDLREAEIWKDGEAEESLAEFFGCGKPEVIRVMQAQGRSITDNDTTEPCWGAKCKYHKHVDTEKCKEEEETTK